MLVCPEVSGRDEDFMMRIADALKKSNNKVVCDRWFEDSKNAEENMLHWVYEQTKIAEKVQKIRRNAHHVFLIFRSSFFILHTTIHGVVSMTSLTTSSRVPIRDWLTLLSLQKHSEVCRKKLNTYCLVIRNF